MVYSYRNEDLPHQALIDKFLNAPIEVTGVTSYLTSIYNLARNQPKAMTRILKSDWSIAKHSIRTKLNEKRRKKLLIGKNAFTTK